MTLRFRLTYILILINLAVYLCTSIISGDFIFTDDTLLMQLGQWNYMVLSGHYWQLLTAMFIHVNLIHLTVNLFFLLIFGLRAEQLFTMPEYIFIYFLSGLAGNLSTLLLGPYTVSAGASGAIFGLFGACIIYIRRTIGQSIVSALLYGFILLMLSNAPGVNFLAHLGGLAAGLTIGYVVASRRSFQITYQYAISYG
ncbi:rhomboid family intramembrane serine protease [Candidatus Bathyarchaeota archaeon]|nr:rhomboid family intramembrane serine protease [Candidatus Bathyarchaeota archaeon]